MDCPVLRLVVRAALPRSTNNVGCVASWQVSLDKGSIKYIDYGCPLLVFNLIFLKLEASQMICQGTTAKAHTHRFLIKDTQLKGV